MTADSAAGAPVAFAEGVLDDVRELTTISSEDREHAAEVEALKQRIAELPGARLIAALLHDCGTAAFGAI